MNNLRFSPGKRYLIFIFVTAACFIFGYIVMSVVLLKGVTPGRMKLVSVVQSIIIFMLPALLTALLVTYKPWKYLRTKSFPLVQAFLGVVGLLVAVPAMNVITEWNLSLTLPDSLAGVEQWMRQSEQAAQAGVDVLMGGSTIGDLIIGLIVIGILPGVGEEFFFRGGMQRLIASTPRVSPHVAVWVTALIFSAVHLQFFGFIPRLLLGAYFGYLLYWTRSLWVPVLVHAVNNSIIVVTSWQARAGQSSIDVENVGSDSWAIVTCSVLFTALVLIAITRRKPVLSAENQPLA